MYWVIECETETASKFSIFHGQNFSRVHAIIGIEFRVVYQLIAELEFAVQLRYFDELEKKLKLKFIWGDI